MASSSRTPSEYNTSSALISASEEGDDGQSNPNILSTPRAFSYQVKNETVAIKSQSQEVKMAKSGHENTNKKIYKMQGNLYRQRATM